jgi:hypothetical protein
MNIISFPLRLVIMPKVDFENRIIDFDSKLFVTATTSLRHAADPRGNGAK